MGVPALKPRDPINVWQIMGRVRVDVVGKKAARAYSLAQRSDQIQKDCLFFVKIMKST